MDLNNDNFIDLFRSVAGGVMPLFGAVLVAVSLFQVVRSLWRRKSPGNWFTVAGMFIMGCACIIVGLRYFPIQR